MTLLDLGYTDTLEKFRIENNLQEFAVGRVVAEHRERYVVRTEQGDVDTEITGAMRFSAKNREDFPAVGDWVALTMYDPDFSIINMIMPRFSMICRQAVGGFGEKQIIATNINYAFLVQAIDRDFNVNRLERYLTICYSSKVTPIIVLTKIDLINEEQCAGIIAEIRQRIDDVPVIALSSKTGEGYEAVEKVIEPGTTYCLLGSSGAGKSTLLNKLSGKTVMRTDAISDSTGKGRHITSHRELIVLENGGILIDNPGMREVGVADAATGLETTFDNLLGYAGNCRFKDCTHTHEAGCAVLAAVEEGTIDRGSYDSYLKMQKEQAWFESTLQERRKKDKSFGKMLKNYHKGIKKSGVV
jgi:ribosome biogenesis GTPase